jgi:hypothetical protein
MLPLVAMRWTDVGTLLIALGALSCNGSQSAADACISAGGQCVVGPATNCAKSGGSCNTDPLPGGAVCCLEFVDAAGDGDVGDGGVTGNDASSQPPCGACASGQQCVEWVGTAQNVCAGPACGRSVDGGACGPGSSCQAVRYDPCPPPPPGQVQCNIASVTYQACVADAVDANTE